MRTTLDIDADILAATKEISSRTKRSAGKVLSDLARKALSASSPPVENQPRMVNGFEVLPARGRVVTSEQVRELMEDGEPS